MNFFKAGFLLLPLLAISAQASECLPFGSSGVSKYSHKVESFKASKASCVFDKKDVFSLRKFKLNGKSVRLVVEPGKIKSYVVSESCLRSCSELTNREMRGTNYGKLFNHSHSEDHKMQNYGLKGGASDKYVALTIDMCPSSKGISQEVYDALVGLADKKGITVPIGVAMTSKWKARHGERFAWLKKKARQGKFKIEWINHSSTHHYKRGVKLSRNFMRARGTDVTKEILGNEISMLKGGVTPSVYFRFPGLVSSETLVDKLSAWGLIPLGSNAWLGKGEKAKDGSIILIHGNRNEPKGEMKFFQYIKRMDRQRHAFGSLYDVFYN